MLLAAAIANSDKPAEKAKCLADTAKRFDSMPASLMRLKNYAMLREQSVEEMRR